MLSRVEEEKKFYNLGARNSIEMARLAEQVRRVLDEFDKLDTRPETASEW